VSARPKSVTSSHTWQYAESMGDKRRVLVISGPNLNLLGHREPEIYGNDTLDDVVGEALQAAESLNLVVSHEQTNSSSRMVEAIHEARGSIDAIIINPGAFTHYAWSIHDALRAFDGPIVEVHLSNPKQREEWRSSSVVAPLASGTIAGFGRHGYRLAILAVSSLLD